MVPPPPNRPPKSSSKPRDPEKDNLSESDDAGSQSDTPMSAEAGVLDTSDYSVYELPDDWMSTVMHLQLLPCLRKVTRTRQKLLYSREYWRELNLAVGSQTAIAKI